MTPLHSPIRQAKADDKGKEKSMSGFRKGADYLKASASRSPGGDRFVNNFLSWKDGETKTVRFLTDGDQIITVAVHEQVDCFDGKKRSFVCRREIDGKDSPCELCDIANASQNQRARRRELGYGIAVLRLEHRNEKGQVDSYVDATDTVDGKAVPVVGIIRQGPKNFWAQALAAFEKYGTLLDRDYDIGRRGSTTDTTYTMFPNAPVALPDGVADWNAYLSNRYTGYVPDLEALLTRMGSQEYYDRFIRGEVADEAAAAPVAVTAPTGFTDETEFDRIKREREATLAAPTGSYE